MPPVKANGFFDNKDVDRSNNLLFLKNGITQVRFLPAYSSKGAWFREIKEIPLTIDGKYSPVISPSTLGKPCPFDQEGRRLYNEGGEKNVELASALRPRSSFLFNVVVKSAPGSEQLDIANCVKILKCGKSIRNNLLDLDQDFSGGWGDITNLEKGVDIRITKSGSGKTDTKYIVKGVPGRTNILTWLEEHGFSGELKPFDLDVLPNYEPKPYEELVALLARFKKELENGAPPGLETGNPFEGLENQKTLNMPTAPVQGGISVPKLEE